MKKYNFVSVFLLFALLVSSFSPALAGGSSAGVYETNVRDKYLVAGEADQLMLSFTVEPWASIPGGLTVDSLDITCAPSHGLTTLKLMDGATELGRTDFVPGEVPGNQSAHIGASNHLLPNGQATELRLLVTVEGNTGDFKTACAIDDMFLKNTESGWTFSSEAQNDRFEGTNRLIYIDDLTVSNSTSSYNVFDSKLRPTDLPLDSQNNLLMDFSINAPEDRVVEDLFIFCDRGNNIKEYRLEANGKVFDYAAMQNNGYTNARPEHSSVDRIVFSDLGVVTGYGAGVNFKLYGDTYNYFSHLPSVEMACSVIDARVRVYQENSDDVTTYEKSLVVNPSQSLTDRLLGNILLQVETLGQAWYLDPVSKLKYFLPDGTVAYDALRNFGLGITDADLSKIPVGIEARFEDTDSDGDGLADRLEEGLKTNVNKADTDGDGVSDGDEINNGTDPLGPGDLVFNSTLAHNLSGRILLQVESRGEAWYVNPADGKRYYMKNGDAAYQIMRFLSLGITNNDIRKIKVGAM